MSKKHNPFVDVNSFLPLTDFRGRSADNQIPYRKNTEEVKVRAECKKLPEELKGHEETGGGYCGGCWG